MKIPTTILFPFFLVFIACSSNKKLTKVNNVGPETCKTKMQELNGTYSGQCKDGFAQGQGKATGQSKTYSGEFNNGLPDGKGTLTTHYNGNKKVKDGYWNQGEYVGKKRVDPYQITEKEFVRHVIVKRLNKTGNQIKIEIKTSPTNLKQTKLSNITLYGNSGNKSNSSRFRGFEETTFPFKGRVDFYIKTVGDYKQSKNGHVEFLINMPGSWLIQIKAV